MKKHDFLTQPHSYLRAQRTANVMTPMADNHATTADRVIGIALILALGFCLGLLVAGV